MASENPEDGIAQQGDGENTAWGEDGGYGATEGQQTEHYSHDQQSQEEEEVVDDDEEEEEPTVSADPSFNASGDAPSDAEEDGGEYDPESITMAETTPTPAVAPAPPERSTATASPRPSKKPKKAGGFIVGSSDDEDESPPPPAPASSNAPKTVPSELQSRTFTNSPLQQSTTSAEITINSNAGAPAAQVSNGLSTASPGANASAPKPRLPTDTIGLLEDRIKDDPRGDMDAWLALIEEYRRRNIIQDTRAVYERFLKVFPQSAEIWVRYLHDELSLDNFAEAEQIFQRTLMSIPSVQLWTAYLDYIRRRNDLNDGTGQARQTVNASYEFVLDNIGQDRDSGRIWHEYIQFIKSGPGQIDGKGWQDMQKMDVLRKAYQRAICIPMSNLNLLWKEYDQFELGINKVAGRKFLQEKSPSYMSARSANTHLENITRGLQRTTLPRLPPAPGFEGDQEFLEQVDLWKRWIAWEKDDPLVLKADEPETYKARIIHVYKQALMALRFWPEMWVDAAEWCFENNVYGKDGSDLGLPFLMEGIAANPESTLLALKHADRIESTHPTGEGEDGKAALSQAVRAPFDTVLTALYDMVKKLKEREATAVHTIQNDPTLASSGDTKDAEDGDPMSKALKASTKEDRVKAVREGFAVQIQMLSQQISYLWIALVRAFRRIQGQGKGNPPGGVRAIFTEARSKGRLTSDVYVAVAHIEWDIYQDPVATKIFERGAKLFPEDEHFMVAYLKHLHSRHDTTNARVVFSQTIKRFKEKPELAPKLKPLYLYFHGYEAKFGELAQIKELEKQMAECFPEDPTLAHFSARFASERFNPIMARVIISPAAQMRPKSIMQSVEQVPVSARASPHPSVLADRSPRLQHLQTQTVNSPKRPFQADDQEDYNPPRKLPRGASPLKGAAGRRLDQQRRAQGQGVASYSSTPAPISRDITFLLGLIPPAHQYGAQRFKPDAMVRTIRDTHVPDYSEWKNAQAQGLRNDPRGHGRQVSTDFASMMNNRNSPAPSGRPDSPYMRGSMRMPPQPGVQYAHRPGSSDDYEPTQDWAQGSIPGQYGQQNFTPQHANPYMAPGAPPGGMSGYPGQPNTYYGGPQY